jgi:hypothetical protein
MPVTGIRQEFELETRDRYTKVKAEMGIKVDGRELPNMAVIGAAMEEAIELVRTRIKDSYRVVPERPTETPVAQPYAAGSSQ